MCGKKNLQNSAIVMLGCVKNGLAVTNRNVYFHVYWVPCACSHWLY